MTEQLSTRAALICYGLGGAVAFLGWLDVTFIYIGMSVLFFIAVFLTFGGG